MKITQNNRFFSFGCSFTKYRWPTWADLIGENFPTYYNYGRAGAGNFYIFNALIEAGQRHKFTKDDVIIVQWSFVGREDRYIQNYWRGKGCMIHYYPPEYIEKYFDFRGFMIRDLSLIKAVKIYLESIGCKYYFISMTSLTSENNYFIEENTTLNDVYEIYQDVLDSIKPSFIEILGDLGKRRPIYINNVDINDNHPIPSEHFAYCQQILPEFYVNKDSCLKFDSFLSTIFNDPKFIHVHDLKHNLWPLKNPSLEIKRL